MHLLKYFVLQADQMLLEYREQIESTYFNIPQDVKNIMGDISKYNVDFDSNISLCSEKIPHSKLLIKVSTEEVEVEELPWEEPSVEGGRTVMRRLKVVMRTKRLRLFRKRMGMT